MKNRILLSRIAIGAILLLTAASIPGAAADDDPRSIAVAAFELRVAGQVDEAVQMLEDGIAVHPQAGVLHYELARTRLLLLDIPGMKQEADVAVSCEPGNAGYRYFAAMASGYSLIDAAHHQDQEQMKAWGRQAIDELEAALEVNPDHHQTRYRLVQMSVDMAPEVGLEVEGTEDHVCRLEKADPILGVKARCCLVDETEQRRIWDQLLVDHPDDTRALSEAAEALAQLGELERAAECLDKAIEMDEQCSYGLLQLGLAYAMREDWDRAVALTNRYLQSEPPVALKAFAVCRLAMIYLRQGDEDKSGELMTEARELDPHVWQTFMPPPQEIFDPPV